MIRQIEDNMYSCNNGKMHEKDDWCQIQITQTEFKQLFETLKKLQHCCIPHSTAWCSASECPACISKDLLEAIQTWIKIQAD